MKEFLRLYKCMHVVDAQVRELVESAVEGCRGNTENNINMMIPCGIKVAIKRKPSPPGADDGYHALVEVSVGVS